MKRVLCGLLILGTSALGAVKNLTLEEAIELAYRNSYTLKNADIDLENTGLQVSEAYKEALPKIDYSGSYNKNENEIYGGDGESDRDENYSHSIDLVQPLFRGGIIGAGIDGSKKLEELSNYEYDEVKSKLKLDIIDKYITILQQKDNLEVYKVSLKEVENELKRAERKYELKLLAKSDVLPFKTRVINTKTRIIEAENQIKIAEVDLKNEIKIESGTDIELTRLDKNKYDLDMIKVDEDVEYSRKNNRDSKIARLNSEIAEISEAEEKSAFYPNVDLFGGYSSDGDSLSSADDDWAWNAGVRVEMNLFSFGQDMSKLKRGKNETEKAKNTEEQIRDDIEEEVRTNYLDLLRLEGTIAEQEAAVESAEENYNLEKRRYENGLTDVVDFLAIETALRQAEITLIESELDYYFAYEKYQEALK